MLILEKLEQKEFVILPPLGKPLFAFESKSVQFFSQCIRDEAVSYHSVFLI